MAQSTTYMWPVSDAEAVCLEQDIVGSGALTLNGKLATSFSSQVSFIKSGFSRNISITSNSFTLDHATFTVTGTQNGALVTEDITGPNIIHSTVHSTNIFDSIASIAVDQSVSEVKVGTGNKGFLPLISVGASVSSVRSSGVSYALSVIPSGSDITYTVWSTLEQIENNTIPLSDQTSRFFAVLANETGKRLIQSTAMVNYLLINITGTASSSTDFLGAIYLQ